MVIRDVVSAACYLSFCDSEPRAALTFMHGNTQGMTQTHSLLIWAGLLEVLKDI
jgi:hypothetical protein